MHRLGSLQRYAQIIMAAALRFARDRGRGGAVGQRSEGPTITWQGWQEEVVKVSGF